VEPLKEWRLKARFIKAYNRYVGVLATTMGRLAAPTPLALWSRSLCWISAGSLCKPRRGYHPPTRSLI
jgi:hypothetical protein